MAYPSTVNFRHVGSEMGLQPIHETSTTQKHALGTEAVAVDATLGRGTFVYLKGVASTVQGALVSYDAKTAETVLAVAAGASSRGPVAIAASANVASQYGWYQVSGSGYVRSATAVADNGAIYLTATAGQVDDAVITGEQVSGMRAKAASALGTTAWAVDTVVSEGDLYTSDSGKVYRCIKGGETTQAWVASTRYVPGMMVTNDTNKVYVCIVGGVADSSGGPTGTNTSGITDNTCTWGYVAASGGPVTGTTSRIVDNAVVWTYHAAAAANFYTVQVALDRPSVTGNDLGATLYKIALSAAAESANAIVVTGTVTALDGTAVGNVPVLISTLAVTDSKGDIGAASTGTVVKTINPATSQNFSWVTTAAGVFVISIGNDAAEVTLFTAMASNALPALLVLDFAAV